MKKLLFALVLLLAVSTVYSQSFNYPSARKTDVVDDYFGVKVEDPYRWMEDLNSPELKDWVTQENQLTFSFLDKIPYREKIRQRLNEVWNYPKYTAPFKAGKYYFFYKNDGLQNQSILYYQKGIDGTPEVFLDPNTFSDNGTVALSMISGSFDGKYMVYGVSKAGSDWTEFYVMDIAAKTKLIDHLQWIKFSGVSWYGSGFYYNRYEAPEDGKEMSDKNQSPKVYFHTIGTEQSSDKLFYEDKENPDMSFGVYVTRDERFMFLTKSKKGTDGNELYFKDLKAAANQYRPIAAGFDYEFNTIGNEGDYIYIMTNKNAPRNKIVKFNIKNDEITDVIPEKFDVLENASISHSKILIQYMKDVTDRIYTYGLNGNILEEYPLPTLGTVTGFWADKDEDEIYFSFTSILYPATIMKFDIVNNKLSIYRKSEIKFDPNNYETKQVFYTSKDSTKIPMFIVHKKGITLDGNNPTLLYGYGGFNINMKPSFNTSNIILLENGGVYAVANLRGGGEYGEEWHKAGTKLNKQNVFDDFISAAEYLIKNGYTNPEKLAIEGGSNGGLLIGAVINQRPYLFSVAFPAVGVMDMLRFHKFTIGWAWVSDYGSSDDKEGFDNLIKFSPYHNINPELNYPATLITTSDHDDRVVPSHSFKYAARLQELYKGNNPVMIRIETNAGHGSGRPTKMIIDAQTDKWSFMFYNMGISPSY
ncbi:MAG: prolyl oligopeptidase family serine peptidase [Ignavibacteria bacterium]|nr:prolyl oligopeptidase family serine peptidase [Ignavibacteria bacterium]